MKKEKSLNTIIRSQSNNFNVLSTESLQQITGGKGKKRGIGDDIIWDIVD